MFRYHISEGKTLERKHFLKSFRIIFIKDLFDGKKEIFFKDILSKEQKKTFFCLLTFVTRM
jgi:hypothetical protein